jgi:flagellar hook-associated protein 3 FlgL
MRIATSTIYSNQAASIDNLEATYQEQGQQLSTGKSLNVPSDDPTVIAQDLAVRNDTAVTTQIGKNLTNLSNELTTVDGSLSSLTSIMQGARALAIQGASDTIDASQRHEMSQQVDQLLQEAIGLANTQYGGKYVFAGTNVPANRPLVQGSGSPITRVTSQGNVVSQTQALPSGQQIAGGVTLQQAFNYGASDGSPDVFQTLITLRDTLAKGTVVDESAQQVNLAGSAINPAVTTIGNLIAAGSPLATPLSADSSGNVTINVSNGNSPSGVNITLTPGQTINAALAAINALTTPIGVTASFNPTTQRISFSGGTQPFQINDVPSAGAGTTTGNFVKAFGLTNQGDVVQNLSTQLGDVDHVLSNTLNARAVVGSTIQSTQALGGAASSQVLNDTQVQSGLEDTDIAKVMTQFSQTQTALQAAYGTTTRLEQKSLFDYLQ